MIDIDRFFEILTDECDQLPDEFFNELHQGVVLSEETRYSEYARSDDLIIMGEYRSAHFGNQIVIYYGSFAKLMPGASEAQVRDKIREVVRHEFRHHMEHLAGIYGHESLEREDEIELRRYLRGGR